MAPLVVGAVPLVAANRSRRSVEAFCVGSRILEADVVVVLLKGGHFLSLRGVSPRLGRGHRDVSLSFHPLALACLLGGPLEVLELLHAVSVQRNPAEVGGRVARHFYLSVDPGERWVDVVVACLGGLLGDGVVEGLVVLFDGHVLQQRGGQGLIALWVGELEVLVLEDISVL